MRIYNDIYYSDVKDSAHTLKIYLPESDSFPVLLFFHGGGLQGGDKSNDGDALAPYLTKMGICLVSANYRMYPEAKYPEFIEDAAEAVAWVKNNIGGFGNCQKIYVGGTSAGGYLSMMLCFAKEYLSKWRLSAMDIDGFIHDAGQPTVHFNVLKERGIDSRRVIVDEAAPLWHIGREKSYPPMLIIYSDKDMENRPEELRLTASTLRHFGHYPTLIETQGTHTHYLFHEDEGGNIVATYDDDGYCPLSKMIYDFISNKND